MKPWYDTTMRKLLQFLMRISDRETFGATGFYPIPRWLRGYLNRYTTLRQVAIYAQLVKGADMSFYAPNEYGCAESVTRMLTNLNPDLTPIFVSTIKLTEYLEESDSFIELNYRPFNGCIVMATTGTGNGRVSNGHVGIFVNGRVFSNNSNTGRWDDQWSLLAFKDYYQRKGGMKVRYFAPIV